MSRKVPYAYLMEEKNRQALRALILEIAFCTDSEATYTHRDGRDVYRWALYGSGRCDGGYLIGTRQSADSPNPYGPASPATHRVYYVERLDTAAQQIRERYSSFADCGMCTAVDRFIVERQKRLDAA